MLDKKQNMPFFCTHMPKWLAVILFFGVFFPAVYFGVGLGDAVFIICRYGFEAYFDGLRFANSKQGILTNGEDLKWYFDVPRVLFDFILVLVFMISTIGFIDYCFYFVQKKKKHPPERNHTESQDI